MLVNFTVSIFRHNDDGIEIQIYGYSMQLDMSLDNNIMEQKRA